MVKRKLRAKAKLSIFWWMIVPALTCGHNLWEVTERPKMIQVDQMILCSLAGLILRDKLRSSVIRDDLGFQSLLLHTERKQLRQFRHLARMSPECLALEVF